MIHGHYLNWTVFCDWQFKKKRKSILFVQLILNISQNSIKIKIKISYALDTLLNTISFALFQHDSISKLLSVHVRPLFELFVIRIKNKHQLSLISNQIELNGALTRTNDLIHIFGVAYCLKRIETWRSRQLEKRQNKKLNKKAFKFQINVWTHEKNK